jgi:hypothetical protein
MAPPPVRRNQPRLRSFHVMSKKPIQIEVVEEGGGERFLVKTCADGSKERLPIVQQPPMQKRMSAKIVWYWDMKTGRRKFY